MLWAPWRMEYIKGEKERGCVFCRRIKEKRDEENFILRRGKYTFLILNTFPYNNGHTLIVPYRHTGKFEELTKEEKEEIMNFLSLLLRVLKERLNPDGFNVGINLGEGAGAGISDHLHIHVVPRWKEDTNFMPVISKVKVIPESLKKTYEKIKGGLEKRE